MHQFSSFRRPAHANAGFTLVEMAIVLVIIGLIIGGVLTAQQITQNAKITSTVQGIKSYQAAVQSYNQNYGALPGDDTQAKTRFPNAAITDVKPDGDGTIDGAYATNAATPAAESQVFWQELRAASLVKGDSKSATLPSNAFGGIFGVQSTGSFTNGLADGTNALCLDKVPGGAATAVDQQLDDGKPDTGTIRAGVVTSGAVATAYDTSAIYVMCTPL
jgi:prepilin-type N-terminal cleavage/methylation domain-containing protein